MSSPDLIKMLSNLGNSLYSIQHLLSGFAYVLGILFIFTALNKLKMIAGSKQSQAKMTVPIAYFTMGAAILFLPTMVDVASNTFFGAGNVISYGDYDRTSFQSVMYWLIKTAGVLWFIRGCVLLAHSSNPGFKHGGKGLVFVFAGILAMNFENSQQFFQLIMDRLITASGST